MNIHSNDLMDEHILFINQSMQSFIYSIQHLFHIVYKSSEFSIISVQTRHFTSDKCPGNMTEIQHQRHSLLKKVCTQEPNVERVSPLCKVNVDDQRQLMYCSVPKTANTNWKTLLIHTSEAFKKENLNTSSWEIPGIYQPETRATYGLRRLCDYEEDEIEFRIKNYFKFFFVRHPILRLLSAFRDKFRISDGSFRNFKNFAPEIIGLYRKDNNTGTPENEPLFHEFLEWAIKEGSSGNGHWDTIESHCDPCYVNFDFIGRFENLGDELHCVMPYVTDDFIGFPQADENGPSAVRKATSREEKNTNDKMEIVKKKFENVSQPLLHQVAHYFKKDCDMFGYDCINFL